MKKYLNDINNENIQIYHHGYKIPKQMLSHWKMIYLKDAKKWGLKLVDEKDIEKYGLLIAVQKALEEGP